PSKVLEIWLGELRYAWEHSSGGVLTITMHPEAIGRGSRMAMLERFVAEAKALDGVVFDRLDAVVDRWVAANP
ncbi:MAG: polysaccharide deacetylase family protein, partial [Candidatus Limnocylindrales bacterium]